MIAMEFGIANFTNIPTIEASNRNLTLSEFDDCIEENSFPKIWQPNNCMILKTHVR